MTIVPNFTITISDSGASGSANISLTGSGLPITTAGTDSISKTQSIGTTAEALDLGELASSQYLVVVNTDTTNYVEIDSANTFDKFSQKILPGGFIVLQPQTTTIYAKANTSAVNIRYASVEL